MKRTLIALLGLALIAGFATSAFAATTELVWDISVTLNDNPIDLNRAGTDDGTRNWGAQQPDNDVFSSLSEGNPRLTLDNQGYATIDYGASVAATTWAFGTTLGDTAVDQCVLAGVFTRPLGVGETPAPGDPVYERDLGIGDFGDEDVLGGTTVYGDDATPNVLAVNDTGSDDDALFFKPYNCSSDLSERSLRFLLQTPATGSAASETLTVTVTAQVSS